jgi:pyrimidine operon attenuation protein/uracil phosphoribosyltransferase
MLQAPFPRREGRFFMPKPQRGIGLSMVSKKKLDVGDLHNKADIARALRRLATEIVEKNRGAKDVALLGIRTRGDLLADRIAAHIGELEGVNVPVGYLDITLYRDDFGTRLEQPEVHKTDIMFPIDDQIVVLVDDVLYTGRTIRAALTAILDLGRTRKVQLAVLCDRGGRELPIRADFVGFEVAVRQNEKVRVLLKEIDGEEGIQVVQGEGA